MSFTKSLIIPLMNLSCHIYLRIFFFFMLVICIEQVNNGIEILIK